MSAKPRITWKREPNEQGLASIGQVERGYDLRINGERVVSVRPVTSGSVMDRETRGWYWYGGSAAHGIPNKNTWNRTPFATIDDAKADAEAYVRKHIASKGTP
jgi:hypothetical protein